MHCFNCHSRGEFLRCRFFPIGFFRSFLFVCLLPNSYPEEVLDFEYDHKVSMILDLLPDIWQNDLANK